MTTPRNGVDPVIGISWHVGIMDGEHFIPFFAYMGEKAAADAAALLRENRGPQWTHKRVEVRLCVKEDV